MNRRWILRAFAGALCSVVLTDRARATSFAEGLVSLTYDDGLDTQLERAVPALDQRGLRGTFYVTWENIEARADEWRKVAQRGHEVANHTMTHPCDLHDIRPASYRSQLEPLNKTLAEWEPRLPARDFSYPCDVTDLGSGNPNQQLRRFERLLRREGISSARTSEGPPNPASWARRHPYRLQALSAGYDATTLDELIAYVRRAEYRRAWAIFAFHDVGPGREGSRIAQDVHDALLDFIVSEKIVCRRVCDVVGELKAWRTGL